MNNKNEQNKQLAKTLRTLWHPLLYQLQKKVLIPRNTKVEDELDASEQPPKFDLVLRHQGEKWSEEQRAVLPDGVRDRDCQHHVFEFKITQSVNIRAFKQADMYDYLYPQLRKVKEDEFQTYIVSSRTTLKKNLKAWDYKETEYPGVYESTHPRFEYIVLLLLNELRDLPHNNYFRLFASDKKVRESALESLLQTHAPHLTNDPTEDEIIDAIFAVAQAYNIEMEGLDMEKELTVEWLLDRSKDIRRSLIQSASVEERLVGLEPEQVLGSYKPEQVLGMYKPEQVLGMYKPEQVLGIYRPEQIIGAYKPEEKRVLLEALQRSIELDEASQETRLSQNGELERAEEESISDASTPDKEV